MVEDCNDPMAVEAGLFCDQDMDLDTIEHSVTDILEAIGEDVDREGLLRTPHRVAKAYTELLAGYRMDPRELINEAVFNVAYDEMVIVRDIEFYSMCEHHMLPFIGSDWPFQDPPNCGPFLPPSAGAGTDDPPYCGIYRLCPQTAGCRCGC